jgi:hypothetical protein
MDPVILEDLGELYDKRYRLAQIEAMSGTTKGENQCLT